MKRQVNIRMSDATKAKLDELTAAYGTQAEAIAVAIDRLCQQSQKGSKMLQLTVTFDCSAERADETVILHNHTTLNPRAAVAARDVAAGVGASVYVTDSETTYRVTGDSARKCKPRYD